jgi:uncharacterized protein
MTPEERRLVIELFDRLATLEDAERDSEAERLVRDGMRQAPNAPYALVQTVLVQDEALKRANARIRDLEGASQAPARDTSFLGGVRDSFFGARDGRGSVPSIRPDAGSSAPGGSSPWRTTGTQPLPGSPVSAPGSPVAAPSAAPMGMGMGGSFLGTAASTAAGVIGGALLLDGIRSMMGHRPGAHAAFDPGAHGAHDPAAGTSSPWSGDGDSNLSRQVGLDDIGRTTGASGTRDGRSSVLDSSGLDDQGIDDADGMDEGGFEMDDTGGSDE